MFFVYQFLRTRVSVLAFTGLVALAPVAAHAESFELSQSQMRQLVSQQQIMSSEAVIDGVGRNFGGVVMDLRGFFSEGAMTYRVLLQRNDGSVVEVLIDGTSGRQVSHTSNMGQIVSTLARARNNGSAASAPTERRNNGNARNNDNRRDNANRGAGNNNRRDNGNRGGGNNNRRDNDNRGGGSNNRGGGNGNR